MNRPEPIELENNLGPDAVTGEINRVPWMAYDVDEIIPCTQEAMDSIVKAGVRDQS